MNTEKKYEFRKRIDDVHKTGRRDFSRIPEPGETVIDENWSIAFEEPLFSVAQDLQDYFLRSMSLVLPLRKESAGPKIELRIVPGGKKRGFLFETEKETVRIHGHDEAGARMGAVYLEDLLSFREAPFLKPGKERREPLFSPRMVHSGWGLDQFPDSHLNAIVHAGFDSILLFVKGVNHTTHGIMDFNDLIERAAKYSLDVYFYSYLPSFKHPDEPDAEAFFEEHYGSVFRNSPKAKGLILVGESAQFPSKDPECSGKDRNTERDCDIADPRQSPGFWPCKDYPEWVNAVKKAVRKHAPEADVVFWTYNWGRAPEDKRLSLIRSLPKDITLEATFEMFEVHHYQNHTMVQPDYSITFPGPGRYFSSEAVCAKECGIPLYAMSNTGGMTWDFGIVPYMPFPQQWIKRFDALRKAHDEWNLRGLMDSHHYGWFPSLIAECAKWCFWTPSPEPQEILRRILTRDFGARAADDAFEAFQSLSDAMNSYTPGFDDQAGPLRCGPSYPFILHPILYPHVEQNLVFPTTPESAVGPRWIHTFYQPESIYSQSWCGLRFHEDLKIMTRSLEFWEKGIRRLNEAVSKTPEDKRETAGRIAGVAEFCYRSFLTMLHTKQWWILNKRLEVEHDVDKAQSLLDEMEALIAEERKNVLAAIPLAERDSRLGWEPSMDYICDKPHLEWKLRQLDNLAGNTLRVYRKSVSRRPDFT